MFDIIIFLSLVAMGYFIGSFAERRHLRSIEKREAEYILQPIVTMEDVAYPEDQIEFATLVSGSAVISVDYFKRLLASLRNIFGGTVKSYESLLDRARREALLRTRVDFSLNGFPHNGEGKVPGAAAAAPAAESGKQEPASEFGETAAALRIVEAQLPHREGPCQARNCGERQCLERECPRATRRFDPTGHLPQREAEKEENPA